MALPCFFNNNLQGPLQFYWGIGFWKAQVSGIFHNPLNQPLGGVTLEALWKHPTHLTDIFLEIVAMQLTLPILWIYNI